MSTSRRRLRSRTRCLRGSRSPRRPRWSAPTASPAPQLRTADRACRCHEPAHAARRARGLRCRPSVQARNHWYPPGSTTRSHGLATVERVRPLPDLPLQEVHGLLGDIRVHQPVRLSMAEHFNRHRQRVRRFCLPRRSRSQTPPGNGTHPTNGFIASSSDDHPRGRRTSSTDLRGYLALLDQEMRTRDRHRSCQRHCPAARCSAGVRFTEPATLGSLRHHMGRGPGDHILHSGDHQQSLRYPGPGIRGLRWRLGRERASVRPVREQHGCFQSRVRSGHPLDDQLWGHRLTRRGGQICSLRHTGTPAGVPQAVLRGARRWPAAGPGTCGRWRWRRSPSCSRLPRRRG